MKITLSDGEWILVKHLWDDAPMTIMELTAALKDETGWSKNTVITMLDRLEAKGAVRYETGGRARKYYPAIDRSDAAKTETQHFLKKVYGGSLGLMMNTLVESSQLTSEDIAELYAILDKAGGDKK